jgi:hypothetical protein
MIRERKNEFEVKNIAPYDEAIKFKAHDRLINEQ